MRTRICLTVPCVLTAPCVSFGQDELRALLHVRSTRETETAAYVGERVRDAIQVNKKCATEQQRQEYLIGLAHCAPPRLAAADQAGMLRRVSEFLGVARGKRSQKRGGRPHAFDKMVDARALFDEEARQMLGPLGHVFCEGQKVVTHNGAAEIKSFTPQGGVIVVYRAGECFMSREYKCCTGQAPGSARLQHPPPSLMPSARQRGGTSDAVKKSIQDHAGDFCAESPHQRDVMRKRVGPFLYEEKPALILSDVLESMYEDFKLKNAEVQISFS